MGLSHIMVQCFLFSMHMACCLGLIFLDFAVNEGYSMENSKLFAIRSNSAAMASHFVLAKLSL